MSAQPAQADTAAFTMGPASALPLPHLYTAETDARGRAYYQNMATRTTSWLHPARQAALQDAGLVAPCASSAPFIDPATLPPLAAPAQQTRVDDAGRTYYVDHDAQSTSYVHPLAVERGLRGREGAGPVVLAAHEAAARLPPADGFLARGLLPPWVARETVAGGAGSAVYFVDYRDDSVCWADPRDVFNNAPGVHAEKEYRAKI